jgi:hypothetical protein
MRELGFPESKLPELPSRSRDSRDRERFGGRTTRQPVNRTPPLVGAPTGGADGSTPSMTGAGTPEGNAQNNMTDPNGGQENDDESSAGFSDLFSGGSAVGLGLSAASLVGLLIYLGS